MMRKSKKLSMLKVHHFSLESSIDKVSNQWNMGRNWAPSEHSFSSSGCLFLVAESNGGDADLDGEFQGGEEITAEEELGGGGGDEDGMQVDEVPVQNDSVGGFFGHTGKTFLSFRFPFLLLFSY